MNKKSKTINGTIWKNKMKQIFKTNKTYQRENQKHKQQLQNKFKINTLKNKSKQRKATNE